jgi:hypothetical protein
VADTAYSTLVPRIQGEIPDCPDFFIESRIQEAAMAFFKESSTWRVDLDLTGTIKDTADYDLEVPSKTATSEIISITHLTTALIPKTERQLEDIDAEWRITTGTPVYYTQLTPSTVTIAPVPAVSTAKALRMRVSVYPTLAATRIDSQIFDDNYSALIVGTLARLLLMVGKVWSDPNMGAVYAQQYSQEIAHAMDVANRGRVKPIRQIKYGGL